MSPLQVAACRLQRTMHSGPAQVARTGFCGNCRAGWKEETELGKDVSHTLEFLRHTDHTKVTKQSPLFGRGLRIAATQGQYGTGSIYSHQPGTV